MKRSDLHVGLEVAAVDIDGSVERAEIIEVGGHGKGNDHLVQFKTGSTKPSKHVVTSRQIVGPWTNHERIWRVRRLMEARRYMASEISERDKKERISDLEVAKTFLEATDINAGLGAVLEVKDGETQAVQVLTLTVQDAQQLVEKLQPVLLSDLTDETV